MLEQEHIKTMREKDELSAKKESEYDFRLRLLEKRILMAESEKESHIQGLLESQEVTLKNMNEDCERRVSYLLICLLNCIKIPSFKPRL